MPARAPGQTVPTPGLRVCCLQIHLIKSAHKLFPVTRQGWNRFSSHCRKTLFRKGLEPVFPKFNLSTEDFELPLRPQVHLCGR